MQITFYHALLTIEGRIDWISPAYLSEEEARQAAYVHYTGIWTREVAAEFQPSWSLASYSYWMDTRLFEPVAVDQH